MLRVNLHVVEKIHSLSNKFVTGVKIKVTGESKGNDNPANYKMFIFLGPFTKAIFVAATRCNFCRA